MLGQVQTAGQAPQLFLIDPGRHCRVKNRPYSQIHPTKTLIFPTTDTTGSSLRVPPPSVSCLYTKAVCRSFLPSSSPSTLLLPQQQPIIMQRVQQAADTDHLLISGQKWAAWQQNGSKKMSSKNNNDAHNVAEPTCRPGLVGSRPVRPEVKHDILVFIMLDFMNFHINSNHRDVG